MRVGAEPEPSYPPGVVAFPDITEALASELASPGFELLGCVAVDAYNAALEEPLASYRLPDLGVAQALVVLVGNTRALWPRFLAAYASTSLGRELHPLDAYSRLHIGPAAARVADRFGVAHALRYSFDPVPHAVAVQRLAVVSGAAEASPVGLCVHPVHGPWFSLRAALVFAVDGPPARVAPPTCSRCVERPCIAARARAIAASGVPAEQITCEIFTAQWPAWLAVRDACPIGRAARYSDQQIRYHYAKQLRTLSEPP